MSEVVVRPLVVVREHAGGAFSAHPAVAPTLVCYGADRDAVLAELAPSWKATAARGDPSRPVLPSAGRDA